MRAKRIRGHRRRWRQIETWEELYKKLDLSALKQSERTIARICVHPWNSLSVTNSKIPEPKGETRDRILLGLTGIYTSWKSQLDIIGEPYYLKIWLFEPQLSMSQVVCAIGGSIDFYKNTFSVPHAVKPFNPVPYGKLVDRLEQFEWEHRIHEEHILNTDLFPADAIRNSQDDSKVKRAILKRPHRVTHLIDPIDGATRVYSFRLGNVWLGEIRHGVQ
jgi:hypothetical protein